MPLLGAWSLGIKMLVQHSILITVVVVAFSLGCKSTPPASVDSRRTPDVSNAAKPESAKIYFLGDSHGESVTITVDGEIIWSAVVPESRILPNVHVAGDVHLQNGRKCRVRVSGGNYTAERDIEWGQGTALTLFLGERVEFAQWQEPVHFR